MAVSSSRHLFAVAFPDSPAFRVVLLVCLSLSLSSFAGAQGGDRLKLGTRIQKSIRAGETHTYEFEARAGRYLRFKVGRSTSHVTLSVAGPDGRQAARLDCLRCDAVSFSVPTGGAGVYKLNVSSEEAGAVAGPYDLALDEDRPSANGDRARVIAERALAEGYALRSEWNAGASRKSLEKYRAALAGWRAAGDQSGQSRALRAMGEVYHMVGELRQALACYRQAYNLAGGDGPLRAGAALGLGFTSIFLGDPRRAVDYGEQALAASRAAGDRAGEARSLLCVGDAYYDMREIPKAAEAYENAMTAAHDGGDLQGQAMALNCLGYVNALTPERQPEARKYQEEALSLWRELRDRRGRATTLLALGHIASFMGEKQQALAFYHEAESSVQGCGEPPSEATLNAGLAFVYEGLGELKLALRHSLKALAAWRATEYPNAEAEALTQVARLYQQTGDSRHALGHLLRARQILRTLKNSPSETWALATGSWVSAHLGRVYADLGREKEALDAYEDALAERSRAIHWIRALALTGVGKIHHRRGDCVGAIASYEKALAASSEAHDPFGEVAALSDRARVERDCGSPGDALDSLGKAIDKIESLRGKMAEPSMRASYFATARGAYELIIDLLSELDAREPGMGHMERALEMSERARARSLLDTIVEARAEALPENNPAFVAEERSLFARMAEKSLELARLSAGVRARTRPETVRRELEELMVRYRFVKSLVQSSSPLYATRPQPEPLTAKEIQQLLDPETMLLEYSLGDEASHLWAVTPDSVARFSLAPRADIEKAAREVYELLTAINNVARGETVEKHEASVTRAAADYPVAAARLSRLLLDPVRSKLGTKRLLIVADGALQYIPFAALPSPAAQGHGPGGGPKSDNRLLIEDHEIINLPSASALAALRREMAARTIAPKAVAVIADPVFSNNDVRLRAASEGRAARDRRQVLAAYSERATRQAVSEETGAVMSRLTFSRREANTILSVVPAGESLSLLDFQANKLAVIWTPLNQYRVVHFATHGLLNSEYPELSTIVLSLVDKSGRPQNGFLRLHEVYNLKLPAELVVLSACQTALGKEIKGEGIVGLTRGFMYAGAARVVASLWNVNDAATADLMGRFYRYMLQDKQRPAEALRNAQMEMMKQRRWQPPYYWAAFTLQGEWK